jgi:hypothetical protein
MTSTMRRIERPAFLILAALLAFALLGAAILAWSGA